ncbi:hypothetical protein Taro_042783 [Colocasia esculenta]|uniref:Uncharacterized protein n=1 Tax=Colocasia esculenta TaxID=4460 RepID=A0A843X361_COLES|nr:hypothetical protein [Colocasia esculenta]
MEVAPHSILSYQSLIFHIFFIVQAHQGMAEMDHLPSPVDNSVLYAQEGHRSQLVYIGRETKVLKCWKHHRSLGGWPVDPRIVEYIKL